MRRAQAALALALLAVLLAGCAAWGAAQLGDAPRIWDVRRAQFVDRAELEQRIIATRYRLLGEGHDNPTHHVLRAEILRSVTRAGKRPAVVFEQFDRAYENALQEAQRAPIDAEGLAKAGALDRRAWDWPLHEPLLAAALDVHLPVHAGNASRSALDAVVKNANLEGIEATWRARLDAAAWNEAKENTLSREIAEGHCGKLPASLVPRLALAQRVRDAALAAALVADATADGAILIAGNGHVRADLGVPLYLGAEAGERISVGFVEVDAEDARRANVGGAAASEHPGFDYLWLTDAVHRDDPCALIPAPKQPAKAAAHELNQRRDPS